MRRQGTPRALVLDCGKSPERRWHPRLPQPEVLHDVQVAALCAAEQDELKKSMVAWGLPKVLEELGLGSFTVLLLLYACFSA
jgi:hypothetical protein